MAGSVFLNTFTSGEISDDAWDRNDIQPINKGCREATNLVLRIAGPLGKRRGFWGLGAVADQTKLARLIPFRRSIDDALMLELGDLVVHVWQANGAPLMNGAVQVSFPSPYGQAQLDGLRYAQVEDVIYFRHRDGLAPQTLQRTSNTTWVFTAETFPNGPWLPENISATTLTVTGADEHDTTTGTGAGSMLPGTVVALTASAATFDPGQVGAIFRIRQNNGAPGVKTWSTGFRPAFGAYCASAGRVYKCTTVGTGPLTTGVDQAVTTPPVQTSGAQSDGGNIWTYRHDGAGIVQITDVADSTNATATVLATVPLKSGDITPCFAEGAYSAFRGWPRMWPTMIEERLASGSTAGNRDMLDLSEISGFTPTAETYTPGLGTGAVTDVDAIRRRVPGGAEILWSHEAPFLLLGTTDGEFIASAGLFGEPMTPSTIAVRPLSKYGSDDVYPVKVNKAVFHVTRGRSCLRKMQVDVQQNLTTDDLTFLADHIAARKFAQLAWVAYPDEVLWTRLDDGGLAALTSHEEQQVRGWTRQQLPGGFIVEDIVTLPGPGRYETLWLIVSRIKGGVTQRQIWQQSQKSDGLFIDGAALYQGAPTTVINGLDAYNGETVRVLADGAMIDLPCAAGSVTLPTPASKVLAGLGFQTRFESQTLDLQAMASAIGVLQRVTGMIVHLKTVIAWCGAGGSTLMEKFCPRQRSDIPVPVPRSIRDPVTVAADSDRDPTVVVTDDSAYDHVIYSLRPRVAAGG